MSQVKPIANKNQDPFWQLNVYEVTQLTVSSQKVNLNKASKIYSAIMMKLYIFLIVFSIQQQAFHILNLFRLTVKLNNVNDYQILAILGNISQKTDGGWG